VRFFGICSASRGPSAPAALLVSHIYCFVLCGCHLLCIVLHRGNVKEQYLVGATAGSTEQLFYPIPSSGSSHTDPRCIRVYIHLKETAAARKCHLGVSVNYTHHTTRGELSAGALYYSAYVLGASDDRTFRRGSAPHPHRNFVHVSN